MPPAPSKAAKRRVPTKAAIERGIEFANRAREAGYEVRGIEVEGMRVLTGKPQKPESKTGGNEWDEV